MSPLSAAAGVVTAAAGDGTPLSTAGVTTVTAAGELLSTVSMVCSATGRVAGRSVVVVAAATAPTPVSAATATAIVTALAVRMCPIS
ncbi:hypothetical protein [Micromonospora fluostatini]|uniref:hypothetical protein n=1 Tax=Micromonospora sp. JCM 30529 TaxID=3421643 RepID=UPI003D18498D